MGLAPLLHTALDGHFFVSSQSDIGATKLGALERVPLISVSIQFIDSVAASSIFTMLGMELDETRYRSPPSIKDYYAKENSITWRKAGNEVILRCGKDESICLRQCV